MGVGGKPIRVTTRAPASIDGAQPTVEHNHARSEAREAYGAYSAARAIAAKYDSEVLPLRETISAETELQYNAMQVDAFTLLETTRANAAAKVASIEARRNFWLAYTDLSAAVLGGGGLSPDTGTVLAADIGGGLPRGH